MWTNWTNIQMQCLEHYLHKKKIGQYSLILSLLPITPLSGRLFFEGSPQVLFTGSKSDNFLSGLGQKVRKLGTKNAIIFRSTVLGIIRLIVNNDQYYWVFQMPRNFGIWMQVGAHARMDPKPVLSLQPLKCQHTDL